jgi:hypothetical protein
MTPDHTGPGGLIVFLLILGVTLWKQRRDERRRLELCARDEQWQRERLSHG